MKIILQSPTAQTGDGEIQQRLRACMTAAAGRAKRKGTALLFNPSIGMHDMRGFAELGARFRNDGLILDSLLDIAADPTVDAIVTHCFWDSGLWPARQILQMPVIGLAEASIGLAGFIGRRFAIIAVNSRYDQGMEDLIQLYGARARAISNRPVRSIEADESQCVEWLRAGHIDRLVSQVHQVARACIADGADVLILGCGLVSVLVTELLGMADVDGVPIITPIVAAVKMAETLVDLQRADLPIKSARGYWGQI